MISEVLNIDMLGEKISTVKGDCLDVMPQIMDNSIDMILCDLPYGMTATKWDICINEGELWKQYERVLKNNGVIVLTSMQPYTSKLVTLFCDWFKYELIWFKDRASGFLNANKRPMPNHENILIFYKKQPTFNPQRYKGNKSHSIGKTANTQSKTKVYGDFTRNENTSEDKMPKSVLYFPIEYPQIHNTQKPVDLFRYLIKTYTNEGDTVLDNCMGSGTTLIACAMENRNCIGIEKDPKYYELACNRYKNHVSQTVIKF